MKKLDLMGGHTLRKLIKDFRKESSEKSLFSVFACLRDSEVWIPVATEFVKILEDNNETEVVQAKHLEIYPFFIEDESGGRYLTAYTWLDQMKELHKKNNIIKLPFLECLSWALSLPKIKGIVLDVETQPFEIQTECFDSIAKMPTTVEDEYIYAKVRFNAGGKAYYYETIRDDLTIGDKVIVPFGQYNKEKIGTIIKIERYNSENLPHSYFSTKYILRKVDEEQTVPRKELKEKILLQEQESYELIKGLIERKNLFSFDAYYNQIFAEEDRYYNPEGAWKEGEVSLEQRKELSKEIASIFDELDKTKPILEINSVGTHYANELFYIPPNKWCYNGDPFLWGYLARKFSNVLLPLSKEHFTELFKDFLSFIQFPEKEYVSVEIPAFTYKDCTRAVTKSSVEFIYEKLVKNLAKFDEQMSELNKRDVFLISGAKLMSAFGKFVKITTLKGNTTQGKVIGWSMGNNGFVSLSVESNNAVKEFTIDEIAKFIVTSEETDTIETENTEKLYCFVGVSPKGRYGCNYWYIDEEQKSRPDTYVWVCMGKKNREQIVYVDSVQYCSIENAPYDVEKAKRILRQATDEESENAAIDWTF